MTTSKFSAFTSLTSNVKEQIKELPLAPLTAIVGKGTCYKSSIIASIRFALNGLYRPEGAYKNLASWAYDPTQSLHSFLSGKDGTAEFFVPIDPFTLEFGERLKPLRAMLEGPIAELNKREHPYILPVNYARQMLYPFPGSDVRKLTNRILRTTPDTYFPAEFTLGKEVTSVLKDNFKVYFDSFLEWGLYSGDHDITTFERSFETLSHTEQTFILFGLACVIGRKSRYSMLILDQEIAGFEPEDMSWLCALCEAAIEAKDISQVVLVHRSAAAIPNNWLKIKRSASK